MNQHHKNIITRIEGRGTEAVMGGWGNAQQRQLTCEITVKGDALPVPDGPQTQLRPPKPQLNVVVSVLKYKLLL